MFYMKNILAFICSMHIKVLIFDARVKNTTEHESLATFFTTDEMQLLLAKNHQFHTTVYKALSAYSLQSSPSIKNYI